MKETPNLTKVFDDDMEAKIRNTPEGMAHWAGTGPAGTTCKACNYRVLDGKLKKAPAIRCARVRKMTGVKGRRFNPSVPSCMFFEQDS